MSYQLYRQFNAEGVLLYVGIAENAMARTGQHSKAVWAPFVARVEIEEHVSEAAARQAERWAITSEAPLFNTQLATNLPSNAEVGEITGFTLADAYELARKGQPLFSSIDPVEFKDMNRQERRRHRSIIKRIARESLQYQRG